MTWYETAFGAHYSWLYAHRDQVEAEACVATLAARDYLSMGVILDLGCGEGRHLSDLSARGSRDVVGLDLSSELLTRAGTRAADTAGLVRADMRTLPFATASFGTVLSLFTAFGYFGRLAEHAELLAEIARVLTPGGIWCLDYLNCRRVAATADGVTERDAGPCRVVESKTLAADGARIHKRVQIAPLAGRESAAQALGVPTAGLDYTEAVALFDPAALDALAARVGLHRHDAMGGYDGRSFDPDEADRWLLFYRRDPS